MSTAAPTDLRHSSERELLDALRQGEPKALAELWRRTAPVAQAIARRALGAADQVEQLLVELYGSAWAQPPADPPIERWLRRRCFGLAEVRLREAGRAPAAASMALLLPDLPAPGAPRERVERLIAALDPAARAALVRAHDTGLPSAEQQEPEVGSALVRALLTLAEAPIRPPAPAAPLGDLVLGLLDPEQAAALEAAAEQGPERDLLRLLRRGRRRLEGLAPPPDLGSRVLLAAVAPEAGAQPNPSRDDDEPLIVPIARHAPAPQVSATPPASAAPEAPSPLPASAAAPPADDVVIPIARLADAGAVPPAPTSLPESSDGPWPAGHDSEAADGHMRRGLGLLLIGTALGLLTGAVALLLR